MKKSFAAACLAALFACAAFAGEGHDHAKKSAHAAGAPDMAAIKAEMMKCAVCKNLAAHAEEVMPVMKSEVVALDNGMAITHTVTDPTKVAMFQEAVAGMKTAGAACAAMPEAEWKTALCVPCQSLMGTIQAGATMSLGNTKSGSLMVVSSTDPAVQAKIAETREMWSKMMGM